MSREFFISKCCSAEAQIAFSDFPDFVGDKPSESKVGTCYFVCNKCGKPCDILPLEQVIRRDMHKDEDEEDAWALKITRTSNGYLLRGRSDSGSPMSMVREDNEKDPLSSHETLLWDVIEYFNFGGSKHDPERLFVVRKKQK